MAHEVWDSAPVQVKVAGSKSLSVWTVDSGSYVFNATLKQAAIEEGQWSEQRETAHERRERVRERREAARKAEDAMIVANLHAGRQRIVDLKAAALARGEPWPPEKWPPEGL